MRAVIGVILGIIVALAVVAGVRVLALVAHPLPGMAVNDPAVMTGWVQGAPVFALALFVAAWFLGVLIGGWVTLAVARRSGAVWIVALLGLVLASVTLLQIAFPLWAKIALVAGPLIAGWLATRLPVARAA